MKTLIDRPDTTLIKNFDKMVAELSKYMNEWEIDRCVDFMDSISDSRWDINPSVEESASQLKIILGSERYQQIKLEWAKDNQHLINDGRTKFIHKQTGIAYDGLDPEDNPDDYQAIQA
jgi:hypothetical protein